MEAGTLEGHQTGTVVSWNEGRGMGFIKPSDGSEDRFVHRSALSDGNRLVVGATVTFQGGFDAAKQKPIVTTCSGAVSNDAAAEPSDAHRVDASYAQTKQKWRLETGTVKAWIEERGMGFIAPAKGGDDLFVHRSFLVDGTGLAVGASVTYETDFDYQKQKNVAKNVHGSAVKGVGKGGMLGQPAPPPLDPASAHSIVHSSLKSAVIGLGVDVEQLLALAGYGRTNAASVVQPPRVSPYGVASGSPAPVVHVVPPPPSQPLRLAGVVKSWIEERGMGFIAPSAGGDDHFVHRSFLHDGNSLQVGSTVYFDALWDEQKGKPVAGNVTGAKSFTGGDLAAAGQASSTSPPPPPPPHVVPPSAVPASLLTPVPPPPARHEILQGVQVGTVRTWYEQRGMGFIAPTSGGSDHFVHRSHLTDGDSLKEGAQVFFEADWDSMKGKPIATNVSGAVKIESLGALS